jgi:hypothetical protein
MLLNMRDVKFSVWLVAVAKKLNVNANLLYEWQPNAINMSYDYELCVDECVEHMLRMYGPVNTWPINKK